MPLGVRHVDLKQIYMVWFIIGTSGDILVHKGDRMVYRCVYIYIHQICLPPTLHLNLYQEAESSHFVTIMLEKMMISHCIWGFQF